MVTPNSKLFSGYLNNFEVPTNIIVFSGINLNKGVSAYEVSSSCSARSR